MKPPSEGNNPAWKLAGGEVLSAGRSNAEAKKEIMGRRLAVYNARAATDLALPWHSSTMPKSWHRFGNALEIHEAIENLAKPWGPKNYFTGIGYYTHNLEGSVPRPEYHHGFLLQNEQWRTSLFAFLLSF